MNIHVPRIPVPPMGFAPKPLQWIEALCFTLRDLISWGWKTKWFGKQVTLFWSWLLVLTSALYRTTQNVNFLFILSDCMFIKLEIYDHRPTYVFGVWYSVEYIVYILYINVYTAMIFIENCTHQAQNCLHNFVWMLHTPGIWPTATGRCTAAASAQGPAATQHTRAINGGRDCK